MSVREVQAVFARMTGTTRLMAVLIYGSGMRIGECVTLQVSEQAGDTNSQGTVSMAVMATSRSLSLSFP